MARVLVIDDDRLMRETLSELLADAGYQVAAAEDGAVGMAEMKKCSADIVITDIIMPNKEGIETIIELRQYYPTVPVIAISGGGRDRGSSYLSTATALGANAALQKPFPQVDLLETVVRLLAG